jgi:hypothetical protein
MKNASLEICLVTTNCFYFGLSGFLCALFRTLCGGGIRGQSVVSGFELQLS